MATAISKTTASWQRYFFVYGTICLVVASLYFAQVVILPIVLAILIAFILNPLVSFLQKRGLNRIVAVSIVMLFATLVVTGIMGVVFFQAKQLATEIPKYKDDIITKLRTFQEASQGMWLEEFWDTISAVSKSFNNETKTLAKAPPLPVTIETSYVPIITTLAMQTLDFLVNGGLVLLLVVFMLLAREDLRNRIIGVCGDRNLMATTKALDEANQRVSRFLGMQFLVNATYGIALGIGLFIIGVPFAVIWGFLAAILRYIPYVGPWLAALFPLTIAFAVLPGWGALIAVFLVILALELVSNNVMEPWLYGRSIGVSEVALIISAVFWAWLWGPLGLILSTPITACLVVFGRYVHSLHFIPHFLGNVPVLSTEVSFYQRLLAKDVDEASDLVEAYVKEHPAEKVYDEVLLPALVQAKKYQDQGDIMREDRNYMLGGIRQIVDEIVEPAMDDTHEANEENRTDFRSKRRVRTLGLAWDASGETGLYLLKSMCDLTASEWRIAGVRGGWGEAVDQIRRAKPQILNLGLLNTRRWARVRSFCRRIKSHFPDLVILIHAWGQHDIVEARTQLQAIGANDVAGTFLESWEQFKTHQSTVAMSMPEPAPEQTNGLRKPLPSLRTPAPSAS